jgi:hypothetical protein
VDLDEDDVQAAPEPFSERDLALICRMAPPAAE